MFSSFLNVNFLLELVQVFLLFICSGRFSLYLRCCQVSSPCCSGNSEAASLGMSGSLSTRCKQINLIKEGEVCE